MTKTTTVRLTAAAACVAASIAFAGGCADTSAATLPTISAERPLRIVATIKPIELMVRDVIGDELAELVDVTVLMTPDVSPHGFEPTPGQVASLKRADIVVYNGLGLDDWAARDLPRNTVALQFAKTLGDDLHHHHHHHHDHDHHECDHGPIDEHFWLDVELVNLFASMIAHEIGSYLSNSGLDEAKSSLDESLDRFTAEALRVDRAYRDALSAHSGRRIVTHHNVFPRIADRYHLGEPIVLRPVEMLEPTAADLRRAIEAIRAEGITCVFIEPQFSAAAAERIRDETGVRLVQVDPLGGQAASWAELMESLLASLVDGLQ